MGIIGKLGSLSRKYYLYATLYCVGIIGMLIVTFYRFELIAEILNMDNWKDTIYLLGTLLSLPILAYMFLQKINRSVAITVAGITSFVIFIVYWISTSTAETFIAELRAFLTPFLALFFLYSALTSMIHVWKKVK